ncbi:juvenile hormone esterase-like [Musca domestica]|uniref:Carboxylic ester hydrolase n=1 Tax=Musca domestica TaxID=7370 RepID=A0A1I8MHB6_MUSDO|nr:juvenile hormone esterase-like [Musca domestica]
MKFEIVISALILILQPLLGSGTENPVVKINNKDFKGTIKGVEKRNLSNQTFAAFLGIPYAKAPLGPLRFRDPQRPDRFEGTYEAIHEGFECHSITATNASEDCLNLNVYTRNLQPHQPLPVVIMIHPGGLYLGSSKWLEPTYLMEKDLVLVTFNYRLGTLGFLNLGSQLIPGNAGFKDQVLALQWVQRNIRNFGGNPQDVTLMGYSAGGLSVSLHLVSPMSKGLFHKAIMMSGSLPPQVVMPKGHQRYLAIRQAKRLKCPGFEELEEIQWSPQEPNKIPDYQDIKDEDILMCLSNYSGKDIAAKLRQMFDFGKDNPIYLWLPVEEKDMGHGRFLEKDFYETLAEMEDLNIPLLIGYTNGEFCSSAKDILSDEKLKAELEANFFGLASRIFGYENWPRHKEISQRIREHYFNGSSSFSTEDFDGLCDLFSDSLIRFGAHRTAQVASEKGADVYFYEFRYQEKSGGVDKDFPKKKDRVEHMQDLQYLFNWSHRPQGNLSKEELAIIGLYTDFVFDFVKNGKLSHKTAKTYPSGYAVLDKELEFKEGINFENLPFWLELFKGEK